MGTLEDMEENAKKAADEAIAKQKAKNEKSSVENSDSE